MAGADRDGPVIPSAVKLAGGLLMATGLVSGSVGLPMLFLPLTGWFRVAGPVALILAGGCTFAGWGVTRARAREASFGLVLGALTALVALSWVAFAWTFGAVMPMSIIVAVLSVTATTLIARSLREIRRIDAARE